jgi:hypothetical protein
MCVPVRRRTPMMQIFPLLALSLIIYSVLGVVSGTGPSPWYESESFVVQLMSGDAWRISAGHLFLMFSMLLLFIELLRSTKTSSASILNHAFSVVVFVVALLLFLMVRGYGNSIFFIFVAMTLLDFMAGFIITTVTSRRDLSVGRIME